MLFGRGILRDMPDTEIVNNVTYPIGYVKGDPLFGLGLPRKYTPEEAELEIADADLRLKPFYRPFLYPNLYDSTLGSGVAGITTNRYKLLGSGIPATSYAIAANSSQAINPARNFDMPAALKTPGGLATPWPEHSNANNPGDWMHSDFKDVALHFLHPMYQKMIDLAELDEN